MLRAATVALVATIVPHLSPPLAAAESCDLTLARVLSLARDRAPAIVAARARIDEARARLDGASLLLRDNPELEGDVGPRLSSQGDSTDVRARLSQALELGGARAARVAGATAGVTQEAADADDALQRVQQAAATTFLRTRAAVEELSLAESTADVASELLRVAQRRHAAGDVPALDVDLARLWGARTPQQLDPVDETMGWMLDAAAQSAIDAILLDCITDPVGPEFMAPPARSDPAASAPQPDGSLGL